MKALIQICIYFCVLGFVVHAQTPAESTAGNPEAQMYALIDAIEQMEKEKANTENELAKVERELEELREKIPFRHWLVFELGFKSPYETDIEKLKSKNEKAKELISKRDYYTDKIFTTKLTIADINRNTTRHPENRVVEILREKRQTDVDQRSANLQKSAR